MEFLSQEGRFWLPRQPEPTVHGLVAFQEDGVTLNLEGALNTLRPDLAAARSLRLSRSFTAACPTACDFNQASGLTWPVEGIQETWHAEFLLTGGLVRDNRFIQAQAVFDCLTPWAQPASIVTGAMGSGLRPRSRGWSVR